MCGITVNTDLANVVTSMACFGTDGQLAGHSSAFLAALRASDNSDIGNVAEFEEDSEI